MCYTQQCGDISAARRLQVILCTLALTIPLPAVSAFADGECQSHFEAWVKLSKAHLGVAPPTDDRGACLHSEAARRELLDKLARNRGACEATISWFDQSPKQTLDMIEANESFIRSLAICPKEERAAAAPDWATKTASTKPAAPAVGPELSAKVTMPKKPVDPGPELSAKTAVPTKSAALTAGPELSAKVAVPTKSAALTARPELSAKTAVPTKSAALTAGPELSAKIAVPRTCLQLDRTTNSRYILTNRNCAGQIVLAVVESRDTAGTTACKTYSVSGSISLGNDKTTAVKVNHECVLNRGSCTSRHVSSMFPECD